MSTVIATNLPLDQVLMDVWEKANKDQRLRFLWRICSDGSRLSLCVDKESPRLQVSIAVDEIFNGRLANLL